jgi:hypothetical protein
MCHTPTLIGLIACKKNPIRKELQSYEKKISILDLNSLRGRFGAWGSVVVKALRY